MSSFACPVDGATLVPVERSGIEIDHCPTCRGVWLDRGELDKIIERSATPAPEPYREQRPHYDNRGHHPYKKRKSFFEELFD
ncbi:MAG: zf-TFIIB domain-containing protein [Sphingomonas sp.]|uniref:TFIIB-type zinc ribbon-containing protein n=1 Tax=Sphingomonas sp. TaxID=28214 RepID=UPI0025FA6458|nr:zf-TFIIB domain-containing protein [Sphingomonas sp.]MBX3564336.1 zf-TFIIB domain-containing protein [Sphingomonas sp.]